MVTTFEVFQIYIGCKSGFEALFDSTNKLMKWLCRFDAEAVSTHTVCFYLASKIRISTNISTTQSRDFGRARE